MLKNILALVFIALFFNSCLSLTPKLDLDGLKSIPENFKEYEKLQKEEESLSLDSYIKDEKLKQLVTLVIKNNKNLKTALLNIEASKALYRIEEAKYFPSLDATSSFSRSKQENFIKNNYKASLSTNFELDLFGRIKSLNENAQNSFLATKYAFLSTKLTLISQSINSYLNLASNIEKLELSKDILKNLEETYKLSKQKYKVGANSKDEVLTSLAQVKEAENEILKYEELIQKDINSLELLLASNLPEELLPKTLKKDDSYLAIVNAGISSKVLLQRPDIKELEYKLKAKNANIGVARAAFFPSISLTASTGFASPDLNNLFSSQNSFWLFSPNISLPIFNAGENSSRLEYSKIQKDIALNEYEKAIQVAFKEVNNALIVRKNIVQRLENQKELTKKLKEAYEIALNSYKIGYKNYISMLLAQKAYINSQKSLISFYLEELENRSELYKVLGGSLE